MTPQEKATELIEKFNMALPNTQFPFSKNEFATQCAIICVELLVNEASNSSSTFGRNQLTDKEYWQSVLTILKTKSWQPLKY